VWITSNAARENSTLDDRYAVVILRTKLENLLLAEMSASLPNSNC
jgi:hypothetical protein